MDVGLEVRLVVSVVNVNGTMVRAGVNVLLELVCVVAVGAKAMAASEQSAKRRTRRRRDARRCILNVEDVVQ